MAAYVIATVKSWNIKKAYELKEKHPNDTVYVISEKNKLTYDFLQQIAPKYVFFPHWSWYIPESIYETFRCVVFHMADLPFGRGGSPLQNQLVRGIYQTKISAITVGKGLDTGDIYCQEPIDISTGNANEIFCKASDIIFDQMIPKFLDCSQGEMIPQPQVGEAVVFSRRTPEQSCVPSGLSARQLYDYIRMLDGEGYPPAYFQTEYGKMYLRNARLCNDELTFSASLEIKVMEEDGEQ